MQDGKLAPESTDVYEGTGVWAWERLPFGGGWLPSSLAAPS